jgi:hypothetical protein
VAEIQQYVRPQMLYRYRSVMNLDRELEAIEGGYVFCAPYDDLNDPMEGLFSSSRRVRESENYRAFRSAIRDKKAQIGICSFSEVYDHELMWAHYADRFAGICIGYTMSKLLRNMPDNVSFVRMYYNEEVPKVLRSHDLVGNAKMILSYKNHRWLYEREWRMFAPLGPARYGDIGCVARVYLGSRITPDCRGHITRKMTHLNIETREMSIKKYSLSLERCH